MDEDRHAELLRALVNRNEELRVEHLTRHIGEHAHAFQAEIENRAIELL